MNLEPKRRKKECGQAAVEFALALPLVLLLLIGILELGWVCANELILENITREGVRAGIVVTTSEDNSQLVIDRINAMKPDHIKDLNITITYSNPDNFRAGDITVVVTYELPAITPLSGMLTTDGEFTLVAECTMKMS